MDKTAQDSPSKKPVDMRDKILEHLEALTSTVSLDDLARLSTSDIAETLLVSRSLASQYLNDLVRAGLVVKVAGRPVRYFHRRAVQYPPFGLPILLSGGVGVGKSFLSRLVYEYGKNQGLLPRDSSYMRIDCAGVPDATSFNGLLDDSIAKSRGGVVFVNGIEALSPSAMERCLATALGLDASQDAPRGRLVLSTTLSADNPKVSSAYSKLPICARVPSLKERTPEER
ncbi:MarR family transcriptional regulator, partial [Paratractidigestivibacter sp.]|uniref:MarR family transcriptional regulator n=1 Tax=Paratractidigestivibacter sp. TaxID=2847316 RepID=UPI0040290B21